MSLRQLAQRTFSTLYPAELRSFLKCMAILGVYRAK